MEELRNNRQLQLIVGGALAIICGLAFYFCIGQKHLNILWELSKMLSKIMMSFNFNNM